MFCELIRINPLVDPKDIRPTGIRLHLGHELLIPKPNQTVDLAGSDNLKYHKVTLSETGYILASGDFVLGTTKESIQLSPHLVGKLDGRSTLARLGLQIHCTADIVDGNHDHPRSIVLEMKNIGNFNLMLKPNIAIGMLIIYQLEGNIQQKSQLQYQNQTGVQAPNLKVQLR